MIYGIWYPDDLKTILEMYVRTTNDAIYLDTESLAKRNKQNFLQLGTVAAESRTACSDLTCARINLSYAIVDYLPKVCWNPGK